MSDKLWTLGTAGAAALGVAIANKASKGVWKKATSGSVADDPQDPATGWGKAVAYAMLSGALVQVVRMVITRQATRTYINATGHRPDE